MVKPIALTADERKAIGEYLDLAATTLRQTVDRRDILPSVIDKFHAMASECDALRVKLTKGL